MSVRSSILAAVGLVLCVVVVRPLAAAAPPRDWRHTALQSATPSDEIVRLDIDGDGKPDILERWWNGRRVRWLDENGDLPPTDTRGDQVGDVLQIDIDGDGALRRARRPEHQVGGQRRRRAGRRPGLRHSQPTAPSDGGEGAHWMLFIDVDKDGVLGWEDWQKFDFDCWGYTGSGNWLPDYNGDSVFVKVHADPHDIEDLVPELGEPVLVLRPRRRRRDARWPSAGSIRTAPRRRHAPDRRAERGLRHPRPRQRRGQGQRDRLRHLVPRGGGPGIPYRDFRHPLPGSRAQPRFDACFASNAWRRVDSVSYMPHDKGWDYFFAGRLDATATWSSTRTTTITAGSASRCTTRRTDAPRCERHPGADDLLHQALDARATGCASGRSQTGRQPGLSGHPQADSLGDRGEFDDDDSGKGQLYVGVFDRKLHLAGAEWGAWTVDRDGRYPRRLAHAVEARRRARRSRRSCATPTPTRTASSTRSSTTTTATAPSTSTVSLLDYKLGGAAPSRRRAAHRHAGRGLVGPSRRLHEGGQRRPGARPWPCIAPPGAAA